MLYLLVFILLLAGSIHELKTRKSSEKLFKIMYFILASMLVFRQGQGTDYYNYKSIYDSINYSLEVSFFNALIQTDPGYSLVNILAIKCGIGYKYFIMIFSLATMVISWPFFKRYCCHSIASLLLFFPIGYLIYYFSAIRQAMAMSIILSAVPPILFDHSKKRLRFYISVLIASLFHLSALVCIVIPFISNIRISKQSSIIIIIASVVLSFLGEQLLFKHLPAPLAFRLDNYSESSGANYLSIALRLIDLIPILVISPKVYFNNHALRKLRNILLMGFIFYALLSFSDLTASRVNYYFRMFEALFFSLVIRDKEFKKTHITVGLIFIIISSVLYVKNVSDFIDQGNYRCNSFIEYPYFTVLTDEDKIASYRLID